MRVSALWCAVTNKALPQHFSPSHPPLSVPVVVSALIHRLQVHEALVVDANVALATRERALQLPRESTVEVRDPDIMLLARGV